MPKCAKISVTQGSTFLSYNSALHIYPTGAKIYELQKNNKSCILRPENIHEVLNILEPFSFGSLDPVSSAVTGRAVHIALV